MKPVAIFQHDPIQGPGYLQDFLQARDIPCRLFHPADGESLPRHPHDFSGLVFLGSPLSVNDDLDWMRQEAGLISRAMQMDIPVLGHCFGGQLMAKTLGAAVTRAASPHIGWGTVRTTRFPEAGRWFGGRHEFPVFNWHYETFAIPRGAQRMLFGEFCLNKGFAVGPHLALQCHLEVTEDIVRDWCREGAAELAGRERSLVQSAESILHRLPEKIHELHRISERVYSVWARHLPRPLLMAIPSSHFAGQRQAAF